MPEVRRLDPTITITIPARTAAVIDVSRLGWKPPDPIPPNDGGAIVRRSDVRAAARPVANYILPGVEDIPPNSIGLLEANHAFIEAYMIGLNHEMARQLLVNGCWKTGRA